MALFLHNGGPCPVPPETPIYPSYRGAEDRTKGIRIRLAPAGRLDWSHDGSADDIVAYRVANFGQAESAP